MTPQILYTTFVATLCAAAPLSGQSTAPTKTPSPVVSTATQTTVIAVGDSALRMITAGNWNALADMMTPDAQTSSAREVNGQTLFRTRTVAAIRATPPGAAIIERGFDPLVHLAGSVATVWMPYDIYIGGTWSHCGVDVFTMAQIGGAWRISNLTYSVEQPPACRTHTAGPPPGLKAP